MLQTQVAGRETDLPKVRLRPRWRGRSRSLLNAKSRTACKQFSVKVDTIFEDSPLPLDKWFVAVWCIANAKWHQQLRAGPRIRVTQRRLGSCSHRVRLAMRTRSFHKLAGEVEVDETFIGSKSRNMHKDKREKRIRGRGAVGKTIVQGIAGTRWAGPYQDGRQPRR